MSGTVTVRGRSALGAILFAAWGWACAGDIDLALDWKKNELFVDPDAVKGHCATASSSRTPARSSAWIRRPSTPACTAPVAASTLPNGQPATRAYGFHSDGPVRQRRRPGRAADRARGLRSARRVPDVFLAGSRHGAGHRGHLGLAWNWNGGVLDKRPLPKVNAAEVPMSEDLEKDDIPDALDAQLALDRPLSRLGELFIATDRVWMSRRATLRSGTWKSTRSGIGRAKPRGCPGASSTTPNGRASWT